MQYLCGSASCDKKLIIAIIIAWVFILLLFVVGLTAVEFEMKSQNNDINVQTSKVKVIKASEVKNNSIEQKNNQIQETSNNHQNVNNQNNIYTDISEQIENDVNTLSASEIAIINASDVKIPLNKFNTDNEIIFIAPDGREFKVE